MPCVLWISGDFKTDALAETIKLTPYKKIEKGEVVTTKDGPKKYEQALCGFDVSSKDFTDFQAMVSDAISFLETNFNNLQALAEMQGVTARLDFGYFHVHGYQYRGTIRYYSIPAFPPRRQSEN